MARTILLLTAVFLMAAPASALPVLDPLAPATVPDVADGVTDGIASDAVTAVQDLLRCKKAVQVDLDWWTGETTDTRERDRELVASLTDVLEHVVGWTPVTETTTETLTTADGLLGLLPVTRVVTRVVGLEPVVETTETKRLLPLALAWDEEYIDWTHHEATVYLTLPAGLGLVAIGDGHIVDLCEPTGLLGAVPDMCETGRWCSVLPQKDGWYAHLPVLTLRASAADASIVDAEGYIIGTRSLRTLIEQAGLEDQAVVEEAPQPAQVAVGDVMSTDTRVSPAGAAGLGGLGAVLAATLALFGAVRRLRP